MPTDHRQLAFGLAIGGVVLLALTYAVLGVGGAIVASLVVVAAGGFLLGRTGAAVTLAAVLVIAGAYAVGRGVHAGDDAARVRAVRATQIEAGVRARAVTRANGLAKQLTALRSDMQTLNTRLRRAERKAARRAPKAKKRRRTTSKR